MVVCYFKKFSSSSKYLISQNYRKYKIFEILKEFETRKKEKILLHSRDLCFSVYLLFFFFFFFDFFQLAWRARVNLGQLTACAPQLDSITGEINRWAHQFRVGISDTNENFQLIRCLSWYMKYSFFSNKTIYIYGIVERNKGTLIKIFTFYNSCNEVAKNLRYF